MPNHHHQSLTAMLASGHIPFHSPLQDYITLIWELDGNISEKELILPKGIIEIIFNLSCPMSAVLPGGKFISKAPVCFIQGIHTSVTKVYYQDHQHLFGLRLKPHAVRSLLGIKPSEVSNQAIDLTLINPHFRTIWDQLVEAASFGERITVVESQFSPKDMRTCHRTELLSNLFLDDSLQLMIHQKLNYDTRQINVFESVDTLARKVCFSARHLNRKSKELFGINAEELIRYRKFVNAVKLIHIGKYSLSEVAHLSGFYDQSHFIRVFKAYSSMTPRMYEKGKGRLPFHLFS